MSLRTRRSLSLGGEVTEEAITVRSSRVGAIPSDLGNLIDELDEVQRRLRILEAPSGEALSSTVAKLEDLVANIQAQIDAWAGTRWTNDQIDARIYAIVGSILAGNVTIGGQLNVLGNVTMPAARALDLSAASGRVNAWLAGDGRLGRT